MTKLRSIELQEMLKKAFDENRKLELSSSDSGLLYCYIQAIEQGRQRAFQQIHKNN